MKKRNRLFYVITILMGLLTVAASSQTVLAKEHARQGEKSVIVHPIPQVPIIVNGVKMAPEEITRFNGQALYYLVDNQARANGVVYIFTSLAGIERHIYTTQTLHQSNASRMSSCYEFSAHYRGTYLSGGSPGYVQLGSPGASFTGPFASWNNDIESVVTTTCNAYTKLYDNTNFTGSSLWLACCGTTNDLDIYGWNNRAGSMKVQY